ncbi:Maf family protein [Xanthocytophaga flava]|uniref:Maf family protein n=1 Tax=Xanthocytophaga flava TaxID=3048013 RepID=UPI0028D164AA|nr:Maf family protein [Xanthocytophaga flavus]MDJ1470150.1 Maf family protein [Xanthocytophaga flavus]
MLSLPPIILASNSPRRQQLMRDAGFTFSVQSKNVAEDFPADMPLQDVPVFLAEKKAAAFANEIQNEIVVSADTVVIIGNQILNKPVDKEEAKAMLNMLSGKMHEVITGVCVLSSQKKIVFSDRTDVYFKALTDNEIEYYIEKYQPFDKAGAYGAQEWMGMVGVEKIIGSYFNVMGLPIHKVYKVLKTW